MKIISASRREDMPAFGMNELLKKYKSLGDDTFWVLWTKNPRKIINSGIDLKRVALQLTVTGLGGTKWEPHVPQPGSVWDDVAVLINQGLNPALINWRLDPIVRPIADVISQNNTFSSKGNLVHTNAYRAAKLGITRCITSFVTFYGVVKERWPDWEQSLFSEEEQRNIILQLRDILSPFNISIFGCVQPHLIGLLRPAACIDGDYYSSVTGFDFNNEKDSHQRKKCNCTVSQDIGKYRKCFHGCIYCYSRENQDKNNVSTAFSEIDIDDI